MTGNFVGPELLEEAVAALRKWAQHAPRQPSRHIWSILPPKLAGALPNVQISYQENDDFAFMDRFARYGDDNPAFPYFDPFTQEWLPAKFPHSNLATFRKKTFARSWDACSWDGMQLEFRPSYGATFAAKGLTKAGSVSLIPALACAVWFFKKPDAEWPGDTEVNAGLPSSPADMVALFRNRFGFDNDPAWSSIFDDSGSVLPEYAALVEAGPHSPISKADLAAVCQSVAAPNGGVATSQAALSSSPSTVTTASVVEIEEELDSELVIFPKPLIRRITSALAHSHIRLIGPPGTGKSTLAKAILKSVVGDAHRFSVATADWTSEDIVGGLGPDESDASKLKFRPGLVVDAADKGLWIGIDEINRADIDSAFGELFGLLAGFDIDLPFQGAGSETGRIKIYADRPSGELPVGEYGLPRDWRMIATMNSWDKVSLNRVSFAFSRRWCTVFVPVPDSESYVKIIDSFLASERLHSEDNLRSALHLLFAGGPAHLSHSLSSIGYSLGPGIAKSCIKDIAASLKNEETVATALTYAIEGFLLPQFEGALSSHETIAKCLTESMSLVNASASQKQTIEDELGVFTGYRNESGY